MKTCTYLDHEERKKCDNYEDNRDGYDCKFLMKDYPRNGEWHCWKGYWSTNGEPPAAERR